MVGQLMNRRNFLKAAVGAALVPAATVVALRETTMAGTLSVHTLENLGQAVSAARRPLAFRPQFAYVLRDVLKKEWDDSYSVIKRFP